MNAPHKRIAPSAQRATELGAVAIADVNSFCQSQCMTRAPCLHAANLYEVRDAPLGCSLQLRADPLRAR